MWSGADFIYTSELFPRLGGMYATSFGHGIGKSYDLQPRVSGHLFVWHIFLLQAWHHSVGKECSSCGSMGGRTNIPSSADTLR